MHMATLLAFIWEVFGSNLGLETEQPTGHYGNIRTLIEC